MIRRFVTGASIKGLKTLETPDTKAVTSYRTPGDHFFVDSLSCSMLLVRATN